MNVLLLGGAKRVAMARMFIETGRRMGLEVGIFSYELEEDVPIACVGKVIKGKRWSDPALMGDLSRIVEREHISLILPFVDPAVEVAARFCAGRQEVWAPVSDAALCEVMFDKAKAAALFERLGLPIPATLALGDGRFPKIAKPRRGSASKGIKVITGAEGERALENADDYLLQEFITEAEEYTVDCYVGRDGRVMCAVPRRRLEVAGGEVTRTITVNIPELNKASLDALELTGLKGAVTLQFLKDTATGRFLLMEVNPRLGGGAVCAVHAGADLPELIIRDCLGMVIEPQQWESGVEITRYMQEVVFRKN